MTMIARLIALLCLLASPVAAQPNIVLILVDDMSMNLMPDATLGTMPNLAQMQADGMTFPAHIVTESLCCPSRASIFTGQLPHNTGVLTNSGATGGVEAFIANGNNMRTFARKLRGAGYATAFMGKYLNGWKAGDPIPPGWSRWVSAENGYDGFGYTLDSFANSTGRVQSTPPEHFTDTIASLGTAWITPARQPFFLELAPFAPHGPYVPAARHEGLFLGAVLPKTPAYAARPDATAPAWLHGIQLLSNNRKAKFEANYVNRLQSMASIDEMIGAVRARLVELEIANNTYVIFTSDNGYHMGEMSLGTGKKTPFDFDVRVPMVIVGPGIAPGSVSSRITSHLDLFPTFMEWAGLPVPAWVDGRSMFTGTPRTLAVIEHTQDIGDPGDPDYNNPDAGDPPTYTALRGAGFMYVEYATGEVGYYTDPNQLQNTQAGLSPAERTRLHDAVVAAQACAGVTCQSAQER